MIDPIEKITHDLETVTEGEVANIFPNMDAPKGKLVGEIKQATTTRLLALCARYKKDGLRLVLNNELAKLDKGEAPINSELARQKVLADLCRDLAWFRIKEELDCWKFDGHLKIYADWAVYYEEEPPIPPIADILTQLFTQIASDKPEEDEDPPSVQ